MTSMSIDGQAAIPLRDRLASLYAEAAERTGTLRRRYVVAGLGAELEFAGTAMLDRLAAPFAHLDTSFSGPPVLRVKIWDSRSSSTDAPPLLGEPVPHPSPGEQPGAPVYHFAANGFQALAHWRTLAAYDSDAATGWFCAPAAGEMLSWDWSYPLRSILDWWLNQHGVLMAHGGAVGTQEGGILIVGAGGSGKSTSTLATLGSELKYLGDDYVAIRLAPRPVIHSVYSSGKVATSHLARFPRIAGAVVNPERSPEEKAVAYLHDCFPGGAGRQAPLSAIVLPRVTDRTEPRLVPASPGEALAAFAPSTILQGRPPRPGDLPTMRRLVRSVPGYHLELGSNLEAIPPLLVDLIRDG